MTGQQLCCGSSSSSKAWLWKNVRQSVMAAVCAFVVWNVSVWKKPVFMLVPLFVSSKKQKHWWPGVVCKLRVCVSIWTFVSNDPWSITWVPQYERGCLFLLWQVWQLTPWFSVLFPYCCSPGVVFGHQVAVFSKSWGQIIVNSNCVTKGLTKIAIAG